MIDGTSIISGFIDYKTIGEAEMHNRDWKKVQENIVGHLDNDYYAATSIFLLTCLRFEVFLETSNPQARDILKNLNFTILEDPSEIFVRFANIAAGLESTIFGERAIFDQVNHALKMSSISTSRNLKILLYSALECASLVRQKHGFYNPHSYGTIAADLLFDDKEIEFRGLGIIGAGSMVNDFLSAPSFIKQKGLCSQVPIYVFNRTQTKAHDLVRHHKLHASVMRLDQLGDSIEKVSHIFIAARDIANSSNMFNVIDNQRVVDICFPCMIKDSANQISILHPEFHREIEKCNLPLMEMKRIIQDEIRTIAPTLLNDKFGRVSEMP